MSRLACADCGLPYGDPGWCDVTIPDDMWLAIFGRPGGVLCFTCMARRLVTKGLVEIPFAIGSGPWASEGAAAMLGEARMEARDARSALEAARLERDEANERADRLAQVVADLTAEIEEAP